MLTLSEVLQATGGELRGAHAAGRALPFTRVMVDSRQTADGDLFVALPGERVDGHRFVASARAAGAAAALVERAIDVHSMPSDSDDGGWPFVVVPSTQKALEAMAAYALKRHGALEVIGVTGSLGKTTTKEVVAGVLEQARRVLKTEGNLNSEIGLPLTVLNGLTAEHELAVLEMGMYDVGDVRLLARLARPRVGIVTAVQPVHLERLGEIERIQAAKQELVEELPSNGVAVLNGDDPRVAAMGTATRARVVRYGVSTEADVRARDVQSRGLQGVDFALDLGGDVRPVHLPLLGAHSVYAALAAAAVAREEGLSAPQIAEALTNLRPALRLLVVDGINGSRIVDDSYNASPESVLAALSLLHELPGRRKLAILGDMLELGSAEVDGHRRVGERAAGIVDLLVAVGERSRVTAAAARASGLRADQVVEASSLDDVVDLARTWLGPDDDVLVKGSRAMGLDAVARALRQESGE